MLHPSTKRLIDKLGDMTRRQKVAWQEADDGSITHDTEGYRVTLTPEPHAVLLTDSQGREIETCTPAEFADDIDKDGRPYTMFVEELYREAKRHARGAEEAINAVLAGLVAAETIPSGEDVADDTPDAETVDVPDATLGTEDALEEDATIEDPVDDSSPLEPDAYQEMDSQSDITFAVASLADQVNGESAHIAPAVDDEAAEDTVPTEDDVLTDENTAVSTMEALQETDIEADMPEEAATDEFSEPAPAAELETMADTTLADAPIAGFGVSSAEAPAPLEPAEDPTPVNTPEGGYTPTGFVDASDEDSAPQEPAETEMSPIESDAADLPPMFTASDTEAPDPVESEVEHAADEMTESAGAPWPAAPEADADLPAPVDAETYEAPSPEVAIEFGAEEQLAETEPDTAETTDQPEPTPQSNFTSSFFGGGFGGGLGAYRSEPAPEPASEPDAGEAEEIAPAETSEFGEAVSDLASADLAVESQPAPAELTEPPRSFSLSGIGARHDPEPAPAPLEASAPTEPEAEAQVMIDGTNDLPAWPGSDPAPVMDDAPETGMVFEAPAADDVVEVTPEPVPDPEPDFTPDVPEASIAADAEPETGDAAAEETPVRPVKRFNPWN
jgi:hypothetical protein